MTLFDTAGMERYTGTIPPTYFRNAQIILLVYSIDSADSISDMPVWIDNYSIARLGDSISSAIPVLVGNKCDLQDSRDVPISRVKETASLCGVPEDNVFELSALTGEGFDELFDRLALLMNKSDSRSRERRKTIRATADVSEDTSKKKPACPACSKV